MAKAQINFGELSGGGGSAFCLFANYSSYGGFLFFSDGVNAPTRVAYPYSGTFNFDNDYITFNKPSSSASTSDSITYKKPARVYKTELTGVSAIPNLFNGSAVSKSAGDIDTNISANGLYDQWHLILFE